MGIRAAPKEDIGCSSAELVYGMTLRLPGEFFDSTTDNNVSHSVFLEHIRQTMAKVKATQTAKHRELQPQVPRSLNTCSHVFIRVDRHHSPLQCPYEGPFKVLERNQKYFRIDLGTRIDNISIDRLKPAFLDEDIV